MIEGKVLQIHLVHLPPTAIAKMRAICTREWDENETHNQCCQLYLESSNTNSFEQLLVNDLKHFIYGFEKTDIKHQT